MVNLKQKFCLLFSSLCSSCISIAGAVICYTVCNEIHIQIKDVVAVRYVIECGVVCSESMGGQLPTLIIKLIIMCSIFFDTHNAEGVCRSGDAVIR